MLPATESMSSREGGGSSSREPVDRPGSVVGNAAGRRRARPGSRRPARSLARFLVDALHAAGMREEHIMSPAGRAIAAGAVGHGVRGVCSRATRHLRSAGHRHRHALRALPERDVPVSVPSSPPRTSSAARRARCPSCCASRPASAARSVRQRRGISPGATCAASASPATRTRWCCSTGERISESSRRVSTGRRSRSPRSSASRSCAGAAPCSTAAARPAA